jgi:hypothetical protein
MVASGAIEYFQTSDGRWHYSDPTYTFRGEQTAAQQAQTDQAQATSAPGTGALADIGTIPSIPEEVKKAIIAALKDSDSPNSTDSTGGLHEEGAVWGPDASGNIIVVRTLPGPTWKPGDANAVVNYEKLAKPELLSKLVDLIGKFHIHPAGNSQTSFLQSPSMGDKSSNFLLSVNIVVGARDRQVYFYNSGGVTGQTGLVNFLR